MSKQRKKDKKDPSIKKPKKDLTGDDFIAFCRQNQCGRKAQ